MSTRNPPMKTFIANIQVELTCVDPEILRDFIIAIPFGDHDLDFRIVNIEEGSLPEGSSEIDKEPYRKFHGLPIRG